MTSPAPGRKLSTLSLPVVLGGHKHYALIDSGAEISVLSGAIPEYGDMLAYGGAVLSNTQCRVSGLTGQMESVGVMTIPLALGCTGSGPSLKAHFAVHDANKYRIILGADILIPLGASLDLGKQRLTVQAVDGTKKTYRLYDKRQICSTPVLTNYRAWLKREGLQQEDTGAPQKVDLNSYDLWSTREKLLD